MPPTLSVICTTFLTRYAEVVHATRRLRFGVADATAVVDVVGAVISVAVDVVLPWFEVLMSD